MPHGHTILVVSHRDEYNTELLLVKNCPSQPRSQIHFCCLTSPCRHPQFSRSTLLSLLGYASEKLPHWLEDQGAAGVSYLLLEDIQACPRYQGTWQVLAEGFWGLVYSLADPTQSILGSITQIYWGRLSSVAKGKKMLYVIVFDCCIFITLTRHLPENQAMV